MAGYSVFRTDQGQIWQEERPLYSTAPHPSFLILPNFTLIRSGVWVSAELACSTSINDKTITIYLGGGFFSQIFDDSLAYFKKDVG